MGWSSGGDAQRGGALGIMPGLAFPTLGKRASDSSLEPAGVQHMRLRVCKSKQNPVDVAAWDLPTLTMTPSDLVVSSLEVEAPASVVAGNLLPPLL